MVNLGRNATVGLTIVMLLFGVVPAYVNSIVGFAVGIGLGLVITAYIIYDQKTLSRDLKANVVGLYFSGVLALSAGLGILMALPYREKLYSVIGVVALLPLLAHLVRVLPPILRNVKVKEFLSLGNGMAAFLLTVLIGSLIGRALSNFYELLILYTGFIVLGVLAMLYFREK